MAVRISGFGCRFVDESDSSPVDHSVDDDIAIPRTYGEGPAAGRERRGVSARLTLAWQGSDSSPIPLY